MKSISVLDERGNLALEIAFASKYQLAWGDWGSGANTNFSSWKPVCPPGFHSLGDYAKTEYGEPTKPMIVVKAIQNDAIAYPQDYNLVWGDWKSGADMDGSFWEPVPPAGYEALGFVAMGNHNKPNRDAIVCIRKDLVTLANVGSQIWGDWGSGAKSNITLWNIVPTSPPVDSKITYITSGSFCGHSSYDTLNSSSVAYALAVELPTDMKLVDPPLPVLTGTNQPSSEPPKQLESVSYLPCTMVNDEAYKNSLEKQIVETPFYRLEKYVFYKLQSFDTNSGEGGEVSFSSTIGISETEQKTITNTIGISMTAGYSSASVSGGPSFSMTLSYSFALSQSYSTTVTRSETRSRKYNIPRNGAGALYSRAYEFHLKRADGRVIKTWQLPLDSYHFAVYPT